jgi:hypothetical protein
MLLSQAGRFGLSVENARKEIDRIVAVARQWRESFFACGVSARDLDYIAPAMLPEPPGIGARCPPLAVVASFSSAISLRTEEDCGHST